MPLAKSAGSCRALVPARRTGRGATSHKPKPFHFFQPPATGQWLVLPRDLVLPAARWANQRPVAPRLLLLTLDFSRPPTPGPASSRQTSRCESSVSLTSRIHSSPARFCLQYNTASAPKLGSLCGSSLLAFVFFSLHSLHSSVSISPPSISIQSTL